MGEAKRKALKAQKPVAVDTFGGRVHVEWDPKAAVTPLGQLPFFIDFLKVSGVFDAWVQDCPLHYVSNNAPDKRAVLATFLLSILAGHHRYAHITGIREDTIHPELLGVDKLVSEDAARRALLRIEESAGLAWLNRHLGKTTQPLLSTPWILDLDTTVKCLYGKQEGAVVGYNPHKPGRPSHSYHSALMANTRLALGVEVLSIAHIFGDFRSLFDTPNESAGHTRRYCVRWLSSRHATRTGERRAKVEALRGTGCAGDDRGWHGVGRVGETRVCPR